MALLASPAAAGEQDAPGDASRDDGRAPRSDIIVRGFRVPDPLAGLTTDDELDAAQIAAYGFDTVGEVVGEVSAQIDGSRDGPVILVNGLLVSGIDEVRDLPAEAIDKVQLLGREAASRLGQGPKRRVVNLIMRPELRQWTTNATAVLATAGNGTQEELSQSYLRQKGSTRDLLSLRYKRIDALSEAQRPITRVDRGPADPLGNVTGFGESEIDPLLSALAGAPITIAAIPQGGGSLALAAFLPGANRPNATEQGTFRTLLPRQDAWALSGGIVRKIGPASRLTLNARMELTDEIGRNGLADLVLRAPAGSPFSPFSRDVLVARSLTPLVDRSASEALIVGGSFTMPVDGWQVAITGSGDFRRSTRQTDTGFSPTALQDAVNAGSLNPFAVIPLALIPSATIRSANGSGRGRIDAVATGALASMPAGALALTLRAGYLRDRFASRSGGLAGTQRLKLGRDEETLGAQLAIPLAEAGGGMRIGDLSLDLGAGLRRIARVGTIGEFSAQLNWTPASAFEIDLQFAQEREPPSAAALGDAAVALPNYRVFDFARGETAEVTYIIGGNPGLVTGRSREWLAEGRFTPVARVGLAVSAQYRRAVETDPVSSLPPVNAVVQAAFPDRFLRDAGGRLVLVDARSINFARERTDELRWGFDLRQTLGGGVRGEASDEEDDPQAVKRRDLVTSAQAPRINLRIFHRWTLANDRLARGGLPVVDLLNGGATGYGGGAPRHAVEFAGGAAWRGLGLQMTGAWRGRSEIRAGTNPGPNDLRFAPFTTVNLRGFANLAALAPQSALAKGARVTVQVLNVFDDFQRVRNANGTTPLGYQRYLTDPLGRTVSVALRKIF